MINRPLRIQTGLSGFINATEMVSFSGFCRTVVWSLVIVAFSATACVILLRGNTEHMTWGLQIIIAVLGALSVASGIGAYNTKTVRETAFEYKDVAEAKERGKVAGAAAAAVIKEKTLDAAAARAANGNTGERPAMQVDNVQQMSVKVPGDDERGTE